MKSKIVTLGSAFDVPIYSARFACINSCTVTWACLYGCLYISKWLFWIPLTATAVLAWYCVSGSIPSFAIVLVAGLRFHTLTAVALANSTAVVGTLIPFPWTVQLAALWCSKGVRVPADCRKEDQKTYCHTKQNVSTCTCNWIGMDKTVLLHIIGWLIWYISVMPPL